LPLTSLFPDIMRSHGLETQSEFRKRFCKTKLLRLPHMRQYKETVYGNRNMEELNLILYDKKEPLAIRRKLVDVAVNLPPITETVIHMDIKLSHSYRESEIAALDAMDGSTFDFASSEVLPPSMVTVRRKLGEEKVGPACDHIIEYIRGMRANGDKSGVFILYWHKATGASSRDAIEQAGFSVARIGGGTSISKRAQIERRFNDGDLSVLIGQIASVGMSINLQSGGNTVFFIERDWSRARHIQAMQRMYRLGQDKPVLVYDLVADCEIERINTMILMRKAIGALEVIDGA